LVALGEGAGDLSLTGVAGVISKSGIVKLATPETTGAITSSSALTGVITSSPVSTEVSGSLSGVNSANNSPPFSPGVLSMNPSGSLLSKDTRSTFPFVLTSVGSCSISSFTMEHVIGSTISMTGC